MDSIHSSFKRVVLNWKATRLFIVHIISIVTGKRLEELPRFIASSENRLDPSSVSRLPSVEMTDSDNSSDRDDEIFNSLLVQSIRENHANTEKISDFEWKDIEHQDSGDVF